MTCKRGLNTVATLFVFATLAACGGGGGKGGGSSAAAPPNNVTRFAYVANFYDNTVSSYIVNPTTGQLRHNGYIVTGNQPYAVTTHPSGKFVYITNYGGGGALSGYAVGTDGRLTSLFAPMGCAICEPGGVSIDPSGRFLYIAYSALGTNTVEAYAIDADGMLSFIAADFSVVRPFSMTIDSTGRFAYVTSFANSSVAAFAIQANGALSPVDSDAATAGIQASIGTDAYAVTLDPSGRFAYVANRSSNSISAYSINATTGALTEVDQNGAAAGKTVPTGDEPISVGVDPSGRFVYVANNFDGVGGNSVSAYRIDASTGALTALAGSPFRAGTNPGSVNVDPSGKFLYVPNVGSDNTTIFSLDATTGVPGAARTIAGRNGNQQMAMTRGTTGAIYTPKFAYVANNGGNNVSQYTFGPNGDLTAMATAMATAGASPSSVAVDPWGRYAYVANEGDSNVSQYTIGANGSLTPMATPTVAAGTSPSSVTVDPSGRYAYVTHFAKVSQYSIGANGSLTPMATPTVAAGGFPESVTVDPSGRYVYIVDRSSDKVLQYTIGASGGLTPMATPTVATGGRPSSVTVDPSGRYAYVANANDSNVSQYTIGADGSLRPMATATVATGIKARPYSVTVDPSGKFVYVANYGSNNVSQYAVGVNGGLTPMATAAVAAGDSPRFVTVDSPGRYAYATNTFGNTVSQYTIGANGDLTPMTTAAVATGEEPVSIITTGTWQ